MGNATTSLRLGVHFTSGISRIVDVPYATSSSFSVRNLASAVAIILALEMINPVVVTSPLS